MEQETNLETSLDQTAATTTQCPFCGEDTGVERAIDPEFGPISLDELETLVRNQWRGRLGATSYDRPHSRRIIRALIVYALAPQSPIRHAVTQQLIWWELTALVGRGLDRAAIDREFRELAHAVREVLVSAGLDGDRVETLTDAIENKLRVTLHWPTSAAPGTADVQ